MRNEKVADSTNVVCFCPCDRTRSNYSLLAKAEDIETENTRKYNSGIYKSKSKSESESPPDFFAGPRTFFWTRPFVDVPADRMRDDRSLSSSSSSSELSSSRRLDFGGGRSGGCSMPATNSSASSSVQHYESNGIIIMIHTIHVPSSLRSRSAAQATICCLIWPFLYMMSIGIRVSGRFGMHLSPTMDTNFVRG
jgi:hypothetical protein